MVANLIGCATESYYIPYTPSANDTPPPVRKPDPNLALESSLGMQRSLDELGYQEKSFNPCSFGLNSENGCRLRYFTVLHFQLLCRDTEGTISVAPTDIRPIFSNDLRWELLGQTGNTQTDASGYGMFTMMSDKSSRDQRLIIHIGSQFLVVNVSEVTKLVLPKNFCRG